ncbi:helix-turn-helix transcriptional regulator [Virgifigura deserti]|uniref:helix-turn-helix transcriptional regulator n=1 Tax=Virgifigura deserti TaxID=2268457 RepID=UPI003CCC3BD6
MKAEDSKHMDLARQLAFIKPGETAEAIARHIVKALTLATEDHARRVAEALALTAGEAPAANSDILTSTELAARWHCHKVTLCNWRVQGKGPKFIKIGKEILYRLEDVLAWERDNRRQSTVDKPKPGPAK